MTECYLNELDRNKYNTEKFEKYCLELGIKLEKRQICQFIKYYEILIEWNSYINLTTITDYNEVIVKHFIDSIMLVKAYKFNDNCKVIDIGTGAGFPGIPLKIIFPEIKITLVDSLNKRINFLNNVIKELELDQIETVHGRAEDLAKELKYREQYDLVVSRAVANLTTLSEYCIPFTKMGGYFISYKSEKLKEELEDSKKAIYLLGGKIKEQIEFELPETEIYRNFITIEKVLKTPKKYPRKAGLPAKEPLR